MQQDYCDKTKVAKPSQDSKGQLKTGQGRTGQDRTRQVRTGQDRTAQDRTGQDRTHQYEGGGQNCGDVLLFHPFLLEHTQHTIPVT